MYAQNHPMSTYCERMEVQLTKTDPYIIEKRVQIDRTECKKQKKYC
jgi:hypothetical protein